MGGTTHKLRPSPYLLQVTSRTLFFPVRSYSLHTFHSKGIPESHNLTVGQFERFIGSMILVTFFATSYQSSGEASEGHL